MVGKPIRTSGLLDIIGGVVDLGISIREGGPAHSNSEMFNMVEYLQEVFVTQLLRWR